MAAAVGFESGDDRGLGRSDVESVQIARIHQGAIAGVGLLRDVATLDHLGDRQAELGGELPVALIVAGHRHDGAGSISEENVVGDEDRDPLTTGRIGCIATQEYARLRPVLLAFQIGLGGDRTPVARNRLRRGHRPGGPARVHLVGPVRSHKPVNEFVLGGEHQVGRPEQGVRPRRENFDVHLARGEQCRGTGGASDPVALHGFDLVGPVQAVKVLEKAVRVGGDPHHPLAQPLSEDGEVAALAAALCGHLLVGQDGPQAWAPVDQ